MTVLQASSGRRPSVRDRQLVGRRARTTALWLGLLLVLALSSLTTDYGGPAPTQRNWVFGRLNHEHTFAQTFIASPGELVAVRLLLFANPGDRDTPVTLRLQYTEGDRFTLAVVTLPVGMFDRSGWTTFAIPPQTLTLTTSLQLDVESPTLPSNDWITVMAGPNTYPHGELFVNGVPHPAADLAFQPIYRRRWIDWLLPISRMALGKPGLLGWPPLYALLAYSFCLVLAHVLITFWRSTRQGPHGL
jgi:hypothetical protein